MLSRASLVACRRVLSVTATRQIAVSAIVCQKAQTAASTDPIQKLFIDKIHEYSQKSKAAGGKLVDASPVTEKALTDEMEKIARVFGAKGVDFAKFPTFNFTDPDLEPVGVSVEVKDVAAEAEMEEEEEDDRPYCVTPRCECHISRAMCDPGYYRDTVVEQCAPCADLCEPTRGQIENCRVNCPGYEISTTTIMSFLTAEDRRLFDIFLAFVITLTFTMVVALCVIIGFSCYRVFCRPRKNLLLHHTNDRRRSSGSRKPTDDTPCTESTELHELGRETKHSASPSQPAINTQLQDRLEMSLEQQPCRNTSTPSFVIRTSLYQCTDDMQNVRDISLVLNNRMRTVFLPQISNGGGAASVGSMTDLKHFDVLPSDCSRQPTDEADERHLIGLREDYLPVADVGLAARPMSLHYLSTTSDERMRIKIDRILQRFPWVQQIWCDADGYCVAVHDKTWPEARQLITEAMRAEGVTSADFKFQMKDPIEPQHCSFTS